MATKCLGPRYDWLLSATAKGKQSFEQSEINWIYWFSKYSFDKNSSFKIAPRPRVTNKKVVLVSISPTFYEQLLCPNPFAKKLQTQIVST